MAKELHENKDTEERLILVGIELEDKDSPSAMAVEACLDELEELVNTEKRCILPIIWEKAKSKN